MAWYKNISKRSLLTASFVVLIDLLFKTMVTTSMEAGAITGEFIVVGRIPTVRMALFSQVDILLIVQIVFKLAIIWFFYRVHQRPASVIFRTATTFIIFGWIGNLLDKLIFQNFYDFQSGYVQLDYISIVGPFFNLSWALTMAGWILLLFAAITQFKSPSATKK